MSLVMGIPARNYAPGFVSTRRCEAVNGFSRLEQFSSDWERLWRTDPEAEIFQSFGWARAWWQGYGHKVTLCSLVVFDADEVIGILPLVKEDESIVFLGGSQADYCDILCENDRITEVLTVALQKLLELPDWKQCAFRNLKLESRILQHWSTLPRELRNYLQIVPGAECHTLLLDRDRDVLVPLLGKRHTRRRLNKLVKAGTLIFRHLETKAEAQIQLGQFFKHQIRRRAFAGKHSAASTPEFQRFLRALVDELDLRSELRFGVLELDARPLAWHISFHVNGKLVLYQQTLDVDAWDYAPGEVLIHQLLLYVQQNAIREFDFTHGNEPFKDRFTTHARKTYSLYLDRPGPLGKLRQLYRATAVPLFRLANSLQHMAKRHDETVRVFRSIRLWASGIRARARFYRRRGILIDWGPRAVGGRIRRVPWRKEQFGLFLHSGNGSVDATDGSDSGLRVSEGRIGDLIDLACKNPQITVVFELWRYRRRLKKGCLLYLVRQGSEVILAAWVATCWPEEFLPLRSGHPPFAPDLMLIYDLWIVGDVVGGRAYRELLLQLLKVARNRKLNLGICCDLGSRTLSSELMDQGFRQAYRLERGRIGRRFRVTLLQTVE